MMREKRNGLESRDRPTILIEILILFQVHKITLCQAEGMMKRNRHGRDMNDEELEQNRFLTLRDY
jgi:hypothetical protein